MARRGVTLLLFSLCFGVLNAQEESTKTVYEFMNTATIRPQISKFMDAVDKVPAVKTLLEQQRTRTTAQGAEFEFCDPSCVTVFAPTNEAWNRAFPGDTEPTDLNLLAKALEHHYVQGLTQRGNGYYIKGLTSDWPNVAAPIAQDAKITDIAAFGSVQPLNPKAGGNLFWLKRPTGNTYHVNNAEMLDEKFDYNCQNGALHLISEVLSPNGYTETFYKFAETNTGTTNAKKTYDLWQTLTNTYSEGGNTAAMISKLKPQSIHQLNTYFVVKTDATTGWNKVPADLMSALQTKAQGEKLYKIMVSHVALKQLMFTDWIKTSERSLNIEVGDGGLHYKTTGKLYKDPDGKYYVEVGGVTAAIDSVDKNIPVNNGVVHFIDRPLNYLYQDSKTIIEENVKSFYDLCVASVTCQNLLNEQNSNYTIFAPQDVTSLQALPAQDRDKYLKLHFLEGRISRIAIGESDGKTMETVDASGFLRFKVKTIQNSYVEGRVPGKCFTRSRLIGETGHPGLNGIVHLIDVPLGVPRRTIREFLTADTRFSEYMNIVNPSFKPNLSSQTVKYTVFPPTNDAIQAFRLVLSKKKVSGTELLTKKQQLVFGRTITTDLELVLPERDANANIQLVTTNTQYQEKLDLKPLSTNGVVTSATLQMDGHQVAVTVDEGCYQCTNGVVYPIGEVLAAIDRDIVLGAIKSTTNNSANLLLLALCALISGLLFTV